MRFPSNAVAAPLAGLVVAIAIAACAVQGDVKGTVKIDGSSTVFPITEAVAEEFRRVEPAVRTAIGISGTGGGFHRFCAGETDIQNASRTIKPSEADACAKNGVEFLELEVAYDGLSVVVHHDNQFVDFLTVDELRRIWEPGSKVNRWNQVRPDWPDERLRLFGPGTASGTFDYFTEAIVGEEDASRSDYTASEDDNVLVQGVSGEKFSLGYFGFAFFIENQDRLTVVPIDPGDGVPIKPTQQTINDGTYRPLSRPLFIYVSVESLRTKPQVATIVKFYLDEARLLAPLVGYVALPDERYEAGLSEVSKVLGEAA
ncbi:MAG: PstS family phosphate ABC transporter substrate-binding protein [Chloroflexi bacterium]|nr:PstS family phosphate ABC transporter substrate-binding protein [Chloroflexota bacterium]